MRNKVANGDLAVAEVAARQHGVITASQLRAVGFDRAAIVRRVKAGRLHRVHRGVYAVGHSALSLHGRWMAAILASGRRGRTAGVGYGDAAPCRPNEQGGRDRDGSSSILDFWRVALSHRSAAADWGLLSPVQGPVDVSVPGDGGKATRRGIRMHRSVSLRPVDVTLHAGIPVTTPARTIADLRRAAAIRGGQRIVSAWELRRAIRQADVLGLPTGSPPERDRTRSDLERDFLRLCRRHRLPAPEVNVRIGRHLVDFLWRERRLVVETDSYHYHRGRVAFQDDRRRDLDLRALGYEAIRISEAQLNDEPQRVVEVLRSELKRLAAPRSDL